MAITPIKVLLFLLGGTAAAGGTAYMAGVFDPASPPATLAAVDPAPKGDRTQPPEVKPLTPAEVGETLPAKPADAAQPPAVAAAPADVTPPKTGETVTPPAAAESTVPAKPAEEASAPPAVAAAPADATPESGEMVTAPAGADEVAEPAKPADAAGVEPEPKVAALDPAESQPQPAAPAATPPAAAAAPTQPGIQPPGFDLMRVEADGSIVIAGHAAANAKVEAIIGSRVIGSAVAGPSGDFAIILDEPLKPGDYQIVLRATGPDGVVAMSAETAVVSIPETADGQVLALVEQPGKPAELITLPQPAPGAPAVELAPADVAAADPAAPKAGDNIAAPAVVPPADDSAAPATGTAAGEKPADAATPPTDEKIASAPANAPSEPAAPQVPAGEAKIAVEAVEIEGRRIFVAGSADAGVRVRAYANEILLGEAVTSAGRRFLVEAERDLPVGDYIIRVDALGPDGVKVVARAAVPFQREPGENLAAVAPPAAAEAPAAPAGTDSATPPAVSAGEEAAAGSNQPAAPGTPTPVAPAVAAVDPAPPATVGDQPAVAGTDPAAAGSDPAKAGTNTQAAAPASPPATGADVAIEPKPPLTAAAPMPAPANVTAAPAVTTQAAPPADGDSAAPGTAPAEMAAAEPPLTNIEPAPGEVLAPKLQTVNGSVIIRRGDTLWRISRRVYGRGVRYSTIYLANQPQIRDPDRIYPGQIFGVPTKTTEGESADMKGLGDQAVQAAPGTPETIQ